jgi:hypothetical protein
MDIPPGFWHTYSMAVSYSADKIGISYEKKDSIFCLCLFLIEHCVQQGDCVGIFAITKQFFCIGKG